MTNQELIEKAASALKPKKIGDDWVGDVGCALLSAGGNLYLGVCIDTVCGIGFCAEHSAIAAMVMAGEYRIQKIVAVARDENGLCILSPCGRCREFIHQIDEANLAAQVILDVDKTVTLSELLPYASWFHPIGTPVQSAADGNG
jgi:cytidine deaminase